MRYAFLPAVAAVFIILAITSPVTAQAPLIPKGNYVLAEEGVTMNGPIASIALLNFSDTGSVSGIQVLRTRAGVETHELLGSFVHESENVATLYLRRQNGEDDTDDGEMVSSFKVVLGASIHQAIRSGHGTHSSATLAPASESRTGGFIFAETGLTGKAYCRIVAVTFNASGAANGKVVSAHPPSASSLSGILVRGTNGLHDLSMSTSEEDAEGNVVPTVENYLAAFEKDRVILLRKDGGNVRLNIMTR